MWALALREEIVMNIYVRKNWQNQLVPNDEPSLKLLQKMKKDKVYKVKVTQPRNVMFHRKYFVLLDTIFDYQRMFGAPKEYFVGRYRCEYCDEEKVDEELNKKAMQGYLKSLKDKEGNNGHIRS